MAVLLGCITLFLITLIAENFTNFNIAVRRFVKMLDSLVCKLRFVSIASKKGWRHFSHKKNLCEHKVMEPIPILRQRQSGRDGKSFRSNKVC